MLIGRLKVFVVFEFLVFVVDVFDRVDIVVEVCFKFVVFGIRDFFLFFLFFFLVKFVLAEVVGGEVVLVVEGVIVDVKLFFFYFVERNFFDAFF